MSARENNEEEEQVRRVALQNAQSILHARQRAEGELRKQSEWLRVTLSSIGDAVISTDGEGRVTFMNAVAESLTAWSLTDALGQPLSEVFRIVNEQSRQPVENPALRALKEGVIVGLANHTILIAKDSSERPIDDSAAPIRSQEGEIIGSVLIFRDITDRHQAEATLRESEHRYRTLFDSMSEGFCIIEVIFDDHEKPIDCRFVEVNPAFEKQTGLRAAEGGRMRELSPAHEQHWFDLYGRVALTGVPARFEGRAEALDRWFEISATRLDPIGSRRVGVLFNDITKRRRDEESLRESKARFDLVKDAAQVGFWFCDLPFDILNWDALVKEHFWLPGDATVTIETFYERLHPHDRERTRQAIARSIDDKTLYDIEYRTVAPDGRAKWIRAIGRTFYDREGKPIRFDGVTLDVTPRRQAEQALGESEDRFRTLADNISQFAWMADATGWIFWYNKRWYEYTGTTLTEMEGWGWTKVHHPDHADRIVESFGSCVRAGMAWEDVFPLRSKDGEYRWFLSRALPVRDALGRIVSWFGTNTDITERRRTEEALRSSETRKSAILTSAMDSIITMNHEGRIVDFNPAAERTFGYSHAEIAGRTVEETIVPPGLREAHRSGLARFMSTGDGPALGKRIEMTAQRADGSQFPCELAITATRTAGAPPFFTAYLRDITERKEAEAALHAAQTQLQEHARFLEKRVAERTCELTATNEQLEAFAYSIAHDLRAPLRTMTSFSQLVLEDHAAGLDNTGKDYLTRIQASSEFMDRLLLDLLAYGRTMKAEMELGSVEVQKAWEAAVLQTSTDLERNCTQIEVIGSFPMVRAHEATLGQCLANLLSNAIKFVAPGVQPHIRFWAEEIAPSASGDEVKVCLWVEDNGIGIAPEHHERAFRVFERLNGTRYPGTGIGLSIVRKGIERMGGQVGLESAPGHGARFWIKLTKA